MTGDDLRRAILTPPDPPHPLIQDFLFYPSVFLLTGEPGKGKTVIASQLACCLTSQTPLFGTLTIHQPCAVFYCQLEGSLSEQLEHLRLMETVCPIATDRLYWYDGGTRPLNVQDATSWQPVVRQMEAFFASQPPTVHRVVTLDPIYKALVTDLAKAEAALALIHFSDLLLHQLRASVLLIHHPHRERHDARGKPIKEEDAYYGHSFLRNHVDTAYVFRALDAEGETGELVSTKLRGQHSLKRLILQYHPETYTCSMEPVPSEESKEMAIRSYLEVVARNGKQTDFYQVKAICQASPRTVRAVQAKLVAEHLLSVHPMTGKRWIWVPKVPGVQP